MPIATGASSRRNEVMVWGYAVLKHCECASIQSRNQVLLIVDHGSVQYDFFHLLFEHEHTALVIRARLLSSRFLTRALLEAAGYCLHQEPPPAQPGLQWEPAVTVVCWMQGLGPRHPGQKNDEEGGR